MNLDTAIDWLTWGAIVLPLLTIAWSAWRFVSLQKQIEKQRRFENLFHIADKIGMQNGSIAAKALAVYELRNYPEYSEVILRFCNEAINYVGGDAAQILTSEFQQTIDFFEKR